MQCLIPLALQVRWTQPHPLQLLRVLLEVDFQSEATKSTGYSKQNHSNTDQMGALKHHSLQQNLRGLTSLL